MAGACSRGWPVQFEQPGLARHADRPLDLLSVVSSYQLCRFDVQPRAILTIENVEANALIGGDLLGPDLSLSGTCQVLRTVSDT